MRLQTKLWMKRNKTLYFWRNIMKYWKEENFRDYVRGFGGPDVAFVRHFGELYPDKLVYDLKFSYNCGFFAVMQNILACLDYAEIFCMVPVVQWIDSICYLNKEPINGTNNIFEYFYLPVSDISDVDVVKCRNVVSYSPKQILGISHGEWQIDGYRDRIKLIKRFGDLYHRYCRLNPQTGDYIEKNIKGILKKKRTLGIHIRGTDFKKGYDDHPVCINEVDFVTPAKELMKKYGYERIFLATDSLEAVELFQKQFGSSLVYYEDVLRSDGEVGVHCLENERENHHYLLGLEVLRDAYTLAACDSLLAGMSNVSLAAQYIKIAEGATHEEVKILDHGINH